MGTKLVLLGTGTPRCIPNTYQSAAAVIVDDAPYLIDCGGGVIQRISEAQERGINGLAFKDLTRLFVTHLHPDHTAGLADLLIAPWVLFRKEPLVIYGPKGTRKMCDLIAEAYELGIGAHLDQISQTHWPLLYEVHEIEAGEIYADDHVRVSAFKVQHGVLETYGFKFVTPDKTIVHSSDTCPHPSVVEQATGCDILVHEVYSTAWLVATPSKFPKIYFRSAHTSSAELAEIATAARPGLLVLNHQIFRGDVTADDLLEEVTSAYSGPVAYGRDLDVFV
jgi:ribonuclease BN (tRNA processing enzyme)